MLNFQCFQHPHFKSYKLGELETTGFIMTLMRTVTSALWKPSLTLRALEWGRGQAERHWTDYWAKGFGSWGKL